MADLALTGIELALSLCKKVYNMVKTAKSNKVQCKEVGERVCTLEKMVQSLKERPENTSPNIEEALKKLVQSLWNAINFMSQFSQTKKVVSILKANSHGSKFQEISQKLNENIQMLLLALQISDGNTLRDGLRAIAAQHGPEDFDHPMPIQCQRVPLKFLRMSRSCDVAMQSSNPGSFERANTIESDEPFATLNPVRQSSFDMDTAAKSPVTAMTPTLVPPVTAMNPTPMSPVTAMNPTLMSPVTAMNPTLMSPVTAMNPTFMPPVTAMNPMPMSPVTAMNPTPMSPVTAMNPTLMSPVTAMTPTLMSPVTAMTPPLMPPVTAMNRTLISPVTVVTHTPMSPVKMFSHHPRPGMVLSAPPRLYRPPLKTVTSTVISYNGQYPRAALNQVQPNGMVPPAVFQQTRRVMGNTVIRNIYR
ncbi:uncharacterized protein LOC144071919 [Stigmatopora argus]